MYNNSHHHHHHHHHDHNTMPFYGAPPPMSPRISFSNDFAEAQHAVRHERPAAPPSSDFEFLPVVGDGGGSMMSGADVLFSKGRLLPYREINPKTTTLRDELLAGDGDDDGGVVSQRPPKGSKWKGLLGLRKSHIGSKRSDKSAADGPTADRSLAAAQGRKYPPFFHEETAHVSDTSQQVVLGNEGSSCRDEEFGF